MYPITGETLQKRIAGLRQQLRDVKSESYTHEEYKVSLIEEIELYIIQLEQDIDSLRRL